MERQCFTLEQQFILEAGFVDMLNQYCKTCFIYFSSAINYYKDLSNTLTSKFNWKQLGSMVMMSELNLQNISTILYTTEHFRPNRALTESSADQFYLIRYCGYTYQLQTQFKLIWSEINLTYIYQINDNNLHRANIFDFNKYRNYTTQKIQLAARNNRILLL
ncbi:Hypothetical_protein [Hexamita inflata]|uniref:Hypothetical_protein n=1 Tax=Hexamita inflata TaxID=28002 RepID=A0AA86NA53_9EUKA|nr:Hypothetical protein HINF_LOCUS3096 [Hexamita inflata]